MNLNNSIEQENFEIHELCVWAHISRAQLYKLWKANAGPKRIRIGRRVIVTRQAAEEWLNSLAV